MAGFPKKKAKKQLPKRKNKERMLLHCWEEQMPNKKRSKRQNNYASRKERSGRQGPSRGEQKEKQTK